ncbi:MAG: DNA replication and repair protein RecF [Spirochaetaceae bacterium]|jgi:DNA replication and repair protein RecF|nr:DNA replication and repair protein RecF [Spirochaetaceae bacterium]
MRFHSVSTVAFRNLKDGITATNVHDVFLIGKNGQGKTNFLESLYFCSYAASFRGVKDAGLINVQKENCAVTATVDTGFVPRKLTVKIENGAKTIIVDDKKIDDRKNLLSLVPSVIFCHEDMDFVTGSPERRRWFFDQNRSLYDTQYLDDLRRYRKILRMRNIVLKEAQTKSNIDVLDTLDAQLIEYGLRLMEKRSLEAKKFSTLFGPIYEAVSSIDGIQVMYRSSWKEMNADEIAKKLTADRQREIVFGSSLSGPHRDRYEFIRNKKNFITTASTGQLRLLALLLRVSQTTRYKEVTGDCPVLLIDDVLLELDGEKRQRFLAVMPEYEQAFFTFLPEEPFECYQKNDSLVFDVANGDLTLRNSGTVVFAPGDT